MNETKENTIPDIAGLDLANRMNLRVQPTNWPAKAANGTTLPFSGRASAALRLGNVTTSGTLIVAEKCNHDMPLVEEERRAVQSAEQPHAKI